MIRFDRNNYEEYALDYLENTMDENQLKAYMEFLRNNPDIESELSGLSENFPVLFPEQIILDDKKWLLRKVKPALQKILWSTSVAAALITGLLYIVFIDGSGDTSLDNRDSITADIIEEKNIEKNKIEEIDADIVKENPDPVVTEVTDEYSKLNPNPETVLLAEGNNSREKYTTSPREVVEPIVADICPIELNEVIAIAQYSFRDIAELYLETDVEKNPIFADNKTVFNDITDDFIFFLKEMNPFKNITEEDNRKKTVYF